MPRAMSSCRQDPLIAIQWPEYRMGKDTPTQERRRLEKPDRMGPTIKELPQEMLRACWPVG
jgi:hypothetical protein